MGFTRNTEDKTKLTIAAVEDCADGTMHSVVAHFNPKEIEVNKSIPWSKHADSKADEPFLEFTGAEGRTLSFELLFDAYEANGTIDTPLNSLTQMSKVKQDKGAENLRRPPKLKVSNGPWADDFTCVLDTLSIKVTMFNNANKPVRATVNVKFKEISRFEAPAGSGGSSGGKSSAPTGGG